MALPPKPTSLESLVKGNTGSSRYGVPMMGEYNATPPTETDGNTDVLQLDASGRLLVNPAPLVNTSDTITAYPATDSLMNGTTALTPKFAVITASSSGATQIVAAVSSKKIRVLSYVFQCNATVNVKFQSHVTPTDKTGLLYNAANTGASSGFNPLGHFETIAGEALDINLSGAVAVGGHITYAEV